MRLPPISLLLGGASSGKSAFAERMIRQSSLAKTYIATAEESGGAMMDIVKKHRARRTGQGWRTVEAPYETANALSQLEPGEVALVEDITSWLDNLLIDDGDWEEELDILLDVLIQLRAPVVLVSTDMSGGVPPVDEAARTAQRIQGVVNQRLAEVADLVVHITAGLPTLLKGTPQMDEVDDPW